jgi:hypothetical protein
VQFALATVVLGAFGFQAFATWQNARSIAVQQRIDEDGNRRQIGLWLKASARPADRVFLECLGYIGYFSQLPTLDFPGLSSREVVAARARRQSDDFGVLIDELKPEWVVLRPSEVDRVKASQPGLLGAATDTMPGHYRLRKTFDRTADLAPYADLPGRGYRQMDSVFLVYERVR